MGEITKQWSDSHGVSTNEPNSVVTNNDKVFLEARGPVSVAFHTTETAQSQWEARLRGVGLI